LIGSIKCPPTVHPTYRSCFLEHPCGVIWREGIGRLPFIIHMFHGEPIRWSDQLGKHRPVSQEDSPEFQHFFCLFAGRNLGRGATTEGSFVRLTARPTRRRRDRQLRAWRNQRQFGIPDPRRSVGRDRAPSCRSAAVEAPNGREETSDGRQVVKLCIGTIAGWPDVRLGTFRTAAY
jgi:hypothetical protein